MKSCSRRAFLQGLGTAAVPLAWSGCVGAPPVSQGRKKARIALQLFSIYQYIEGAKDEKTGAKSAGVGLDRALEDVAAIGYEGVEFAGYYQYANDPRGLRKALANAGLKACGTHVGNDQYGFDTVNWKYDADVLKRTCDFNMSYGNNLIICPGGGNFPVKNYWEKGPDGDYFRPNAEADEFFRRLVDFYNRAAADAAKMGCMIGLHNHTSEHFIHLTDGTSYWDYFFGNTSTNVCMEQDVGWSVCAGVDPAAQYAKFPHRSPTLHAQENGSGKDVTEFDGILGRPGRPGATPVDWDALVSATEKDGVRWYVVECERHFEDLTAVLPSYGFLASK